MKRIIITLTIVLTSLSIFSQKVQVSKESQQVRGDKTEGYSATITGNVDEISTQWVKYLRTLGKFRSRGSYYEVTNFSIGGTLMEDSLLFAVDMSDETSVTVWLGTPVANSDSYNVSDYLKSTVYDFAIKYYRLVAQSKVDEAEKAVQITERQHKRLVRDSIEYAYKLTSTDDEIIRLKQLVEKNQLESTVLKEKLLLNRNARDSILQEIDKMLEIVEKRKKEKNMIE